MLCLFYVNWYMPTTLQETTWSIKTNTSIDAVNLSRVHKVACMSVSC